METSFVYLNTPSFLQTP